MVRKARKQDRQASRAHEAAALYEANAGNIADTREIPAGEFKARCLAIMDDVQERGGEYIITKRGVPVAKLVPVRIERRPLLGSMKGTVTTLGDIVSPLDEPWNALEAFDRDR
jgi:prevent-host-death family protein